MSNPETNVSKALIVPDNQLTRIARFKELSPEQQKVRYFALLYAQIEYYQFAVHNISWLYPRVLSEYKEYLNRANDHFRFLANNPFDEMFEKTDGECSYGRIEQMFKDFDLTDLSQQKISAKNKLRLANNRIAISLDRDPEIVQAAGGSFSILEVDNINLLDEMAKEIPELY